MSNENSSNINKRKIFSSKYQRKYGLIIEENKNNIYPRITYFNRFKKENLSSNNITLNSKKAKSFNSKNIKILEVNLSPMTNEYIKEKISPKFFSSKNSSIKLTDKSNFGSSIKLNKNKKNKIINFKTTFNSLKKSQLILRKIDLELNNIINNKYKKKLNLKTFSSKSRNILTNNIIKNIKIDEFNNNKILSNNENYKLKRKANVFKKNLSEINIDNFFRKIVYFNKKNDLISKDKIINLIQNEKNIINEFKKENKNNIKEFINSNKFSENLKKIKKANNNNRKIKNIQISSPFNISKSEKNLFYKTNYNFRNLNSEKINKIINKDIDIKTNYNVEDDEYEQDNNVDNYIRKKNYITCINFFKNLKNVDNNSGTENEIIKYSTINSFTNLSDMNFPLKNNFIQTAIKSSTNEYNNKNLINNNWENQLINSKISLFKIKKNKKNNHFNEKKRRSSIIAGYLSNFNNKSEKYFNNILFNNKQNSNTISQSIENSKEFYPEKFNNLKIKRNSINIDFNFKNNFEFLVNKLKQENKLKNIGLDPSKNETKNQTIFNSNIKHEKENKLINNINNQQEKLIENKVSNINIIYEENEKEKNDYISKNIYFSLVNNKNKKLEQKIKNNDIFKYLNHNTNQINDKDKQIHNKNIKSTYFNINKNFEFNKKNNFNNRKNKKKNTKKSLENQNKEKNDKNEIKNEKVKDKENKIELKNSNIDKKETTVQKKEIVLENNISNNYISILNHDKIENKEKYKKIKEFKDKTIVNIFNIVNKILEEKNLELNFENLTKFLLIEDYKKYVSILKVLLEKEREISELSKSEKIKDDEIIKYLLRIFSDKYSSFCIKPKNDNNLKEISNINDNQSISSTLLKLLNESNSNILSHKIDSTLIKINKDTTQRKYTEEAKINNYDNNYSKFKSSPKKKKIKVKNNKTIKQFLNEDFTNEEQKKKKFLYQKLCLTDELKYEIEIADDEEVKKGFKALLAQIEALKNDDIMIYIKSIRDKYEIFKMEMKKSANVREQEERINYFLNELIFERENIQQLKKLKKKKFPLEDYRF